MWKQQKFRGRICVAGAAALVALTAPAADAFPSSNPGDPCRNRPGTLAAYAFDRDDRLSLIGAEKTRDCVDLAHRATVRAQWTPSGRHGGAYRLNGLNEWVVLDDPQQADITTEDFAIMAWVRGYPEPGEPGVPPEHHPTVMTKGPAANGDVPGYGLRLDKVGQWQHFFIHDNAHWDPARVWFDEPILDGTWHHVAVSVDRDQGARVWVDGAEEATSYTPGYPQVPDQSGSLSTREPLMIGATNATGFQGFENFFRGSIDEVRVLRRALGTCEVRSLALRPYESSFFPGFDPFAGLTDAQCNSVLPSW